MDWSRLQHEIPFEKNFRWRGGQVSRIEAFTDAVFALSVTLLVVSAQVPTSYVELNEVEVVMTRSLINTHWIQAGVGMLSVVLALTLPDPYQGMAGIAYMTLPVVHPLHGRFAAKQEQAALQRMAAQQEGAATASEDTSAAPAA